MATTVIGPSIVIEGEIEGNEDLVVQGTVKGRIVSNHTLVVDPSAVVEADIEASVATIGGHVTGSVAARERVELKAPARLVGNVKAPRVIIADGATFKGTIDMEAP